MQESRPGARTNAGLRGDHAVAALMFRAIEPLIGDTQKRVEGVSIAAKLRHPDADGDLDRRRNSDLERIACDGRSKTLADHASCLERCPWQQHHEFFTAHARDYVVRADRLNTLLHESTQDAIAARVTIFVIDALEMIQVERQQGQWSADPLGPRDLDVGARDELAPIPDTRQRDRKSVV